MKPLKCVDPAEFEVGCQIIDQLSGGLIARVVHGVELDQLVDPEGGEIEATERWIASAQLLAKLPPQEVSRFLGLAEEGSPAAAAARYRIRVKFKHYIEQRFGIRSINDLI